MPSFPPRIDPVKKENQLSQRKQELFFAIRNNYQNEKLNKSVEKYRKAKLSLFKAKIHSIQDKELKKIQSTENIEDIKKAMITLENMTQEDIINNIKTEQE
jgi:hypothetical protein